MTYDRDKIDLLFKFECDNNVPRCDRLTEWIPDYGMAFPMYREVKGFVSNEEIDKRLEELNLID